jgi:TPR repeat protein
MLFHEGMEDFLTGSYEEQFKSFKRAATKGHQESVWIVSVLDGVEMELKSLKQAFAKIEEPLAWYFAGALSDGRERFELFKRSSEGGCSWGQVQYGFQFQCGAFVQKDMKLCLEGLEKAAEQNNPWAMHCLGNWYRAKAGQKEKAVSCYRAAAALGWRISMKYFARRFRDGEGCVKDLSQAVMWSAKGDSYRFWELLTYVRLAFVGGTTEDLGCNFDRLCYSLGWGAYWYLHNTERWNKQSDKDKAFGSRCLDFYCSCVELQQESIFAFLLCWNRATGTVKEVGVMVGKMVWEGREDNLVKMYDRKQEGC